MKTVIFYLGTFILGVLPFNNMAQFVNVSGYVINELNGKKVENASVFEKHTEIGTISDKDGFFKLILHPGNLNLSISEEGYKTFSEKMELKSDTILFVELKPEMRHRNKYKNETVLKAESNTNQQLFTTRK